jgi:hypothetical protein
MSSILAVAVLRFGGEGIGGLEEVAPRGSRC